MNAIRSLLKDRRRSQRGSVLSGVLIMTAFIAIIAGALMTELSTNFILSNRLSTQIATQATIDSAMEMATNQLQTTALGSGCPSLTPVSLNGRTATVSYSSCWPVVDSRSPQSTLIGRSSRFNVDGSHSSVPRAGQNLYIVGDSSGNVYQLPFGGTSPNWIWQQPDSSVTGPPVVLPDFGGDWDDMVDLVPLRVTSNPPGGCSSGYCVAVLTQDINTQPTMHCAMGALSAVTARPAQGVNFPTLAYFGDQSGEIFAYTASIAGSCTLKASISVPLAVVAGPLVFAGPVSPSSKTDEIYVLMSDGSSTSISRYTYTVKNSNPPVLASAGSVALLNNPDVVGIAVDSATLPARVVVASSNGNISVVQLATNFGMQVTATAQLPTSVSGAPVWCQCGGANQIAVAGTGGALYLLDSGLNLLASSGSIGASVASAPATDAVGDWFVGGSDGFVHELQQAPGSAAMTEVARFGLPSSASITSALQAGRCPIGICVYLGAQDGGVYLIPLDARDVVATACVGSGSCSGANPRLWARMEVGGAGNPNVVHVQGWSYYSA